MRRAKSWNRYDIVGIQDPMSFSDPEPNVRRRPRQGGALCTVATTAVLGLATDDSYAKFSAYCSRGCSLLLLAILGAFAFSRCLYVQVNNST